MNIHRIVNPFSSCTYVVHHDELPQAVIVDPGDFDCSATTGWLERSKVEEVPYILLTHEHSDHIAGVNDLRVCYGSLVICSGSCAERIADPKKNMSYYWDRSRAFHVQADRVWEDLRWELDWSGTVIKAFPTPGHSPAGTCLVIADLLFTGDTLLGNKRPPSHLPGGDKGQLKQSILRILTEFSPNATVFPGHGAPFFLREIVPQEVLRG